MKISVQTHARTQMIDITSRVREAVAGQPIKDGLVHICSMHTTGAVTINENADPSVETDILRTIDRIIPWNDGYRHLEGNSAAHIKTSLFGVSELIALEDGHLVLGTWQGIFFCEFDGPRHRTVSIKIIPGT